MMHRRTGFWEKLAEPPNGINGRQLIVTILLVLIVGSLYYVGDGFLGGTASIIPAFLSGQAYHELVLLLFSGVVIYAAIFLRVKWALATSLAGLFIMLPHALFIPAYPDPIYRTLSWLTINGLLALVVGGALNAREQQQTYLREIINAQEQERHRVSRELHDDTAQGMIDAAHAVDEMLEASPRPPDNLLAKLHCLRKNIDDTLEKTRRAIQGLQPPLLDEVGIKSALLGLCDNLSDESGIEVETDIDVHEDELTSEAKIALFRITQEALTNIRKHSEATRVAVRLKANDNRVMLAISDNGTGFVPPSRSRLRAAGKSGLVGIQERAGLVHGSFELRSAVGKGTTIKVEIPLTGRGSSS